MLDENRFFRFLWRINAIAIACVAALAAVLAVYALVAIVRQQTRDRNISETILLDSNRPVEEELILGTPRTIAGTRIVKIPLYREQTTNVSYYAKTSGANMVNELVVDTATGKTEWLFREGQRLILNSTDIFLALKSNTPTTIASVYATVDNDSNGDGKLTAADHVHVSYSPAENARITPLLQRIDKLFAIQQIADDRLMLVYAKEGQNRLMTYGLPAFDVITDTAVTDPHLLD